jgi:hypothetical protein
VIALLATAWVAGSVGWVLGWWWATRPLPPMPRGAPPRRVARPCLVARCRRGRDGADYVAIAADTIAPREAFAPADRRVLDALVWPT